MTNQEKLDEMYDKVDEMYEILRGMRSRERLSNIMKVLYWLVVLGIAFGAYYYVKPVIDTVTPKIESVQKGLDQINNMSKQLPEVNTVKGIFDNIKDKYQKINSAVNSTSTQ